MVELHEATKQRSRLDEAYVRISVGLTSVDRIFICRIDGAEFKIKIEEIKCMDEELNLKQIGEEDSTSDSDYSELAGFKDDGSSVEAMAVHSIGDAGDEETVVGEVDVSLPQEAGRRTVESTASGSQKTAVSNDMRGSLHASPSIESVYAEMSPRNFLKMRETGLRPKSVGPGGSEGGSSVNWASPSQPIREISDSDNSSRVSSKGIGPNRNSSSESGGGQTEMWICV